MIPCFECGAPARHEHHVVPRSRGGTKTIPLCEDCHGKAHGKKMRTCDLTRDALAHKQAIGEHVGGVPFGYQVEGTKLAPIEAEIQAITLACDLRAKGWILQAIADELNRQGIATKRGGHWQPTQISRITTGNTAHKMKGEAAI